ncbi:MAG: Crp/Fnr family transcriptional regulator [Deltaproteobacteria bacterium]|nr:Crp/Fnr family transcriptional regulator [Deltaproteobacteria bacterium]
MTDFPKDNLADSRLKRFLRQLTRGDYLFRGGDMGNTMFIILDGSIEMFRTVGSEERFAAQLGPGEFIGERAILNPGTPYRRPYSARANAETVLLEFDAKSLKIIQVVIPDLVMRVLQVAADRLDRANRLLEVLRPLDEMERLVNCILYLSTPPKNAQGASHPTDCLMTAEDIHAIIGSDTAMIEKCLAHLATKKILIRQKEGYALVDDTALKQFLPLLKERMAA